MKRFILTIALLSSALVAGAQTSIEEVLRSVETNNKELQANRQICLLYTSPSPRD